MDDRIALDFFLSGQGAFWAMANARYCTWIDAPDPRGRPREKLQEKPPDFRGQTPMVYGICSPEGSRTLGGMISAGLRYGFILLVRVLLVEALIKCCMRHINGFGPSLCWSD